MGAYEIYYFTCQVSAWDMNDGDQPIIDANQPTNGDSHCLTNVNIFKSTLSPGEYWDVIILVAEEDGGTSKNYQKVAASILTSIKNPYAVAAGSLLEILNEFGITLLTDTDDWMGMIGIRITNQNGQLSTTWNNIGGIVHCNPDPDDGGNSNRKEIRMSNDGSNYVGWFGVGTSSIIQPLPPTPTERHSNVRNFK